MQTAQACLDRTPEGETLRFPAGVYTFNQPLALRRPIHLTTQGKSPSDPRCALDGAPDCAEFKAGYNFSLPGGPAMGLIWVDTGASGGSIDHLVLNGDRQNRQGSPAQQRCGTAEGAWGGLSRFFASRFTVSNSVFKNGLCYTAMEYAAGASQVTLRANTFAYNGNHFFPWSDGATIHDASDTQVVDNDFVDNTDVDLIFGGCQRCTVQGNRLTHTSDAAAGAFAALMFHAWPGGTSGNYTGSVVSQNQVDCGPERRCGIGILIGAEPWYDALTYGGVYRDNTVTRAQGGFMIADARDLAVYNNTVTLSGGLFKTACGLRVMTPYNMSSTTSGIDRSLDDPGLYYATDSFRGCVPNYPSAPFQYQNYGAAYVSQTVPRLMAPGSSQPIEITMRNAGTKAWTKAENFRLGNIQPGSAWNITRLELDAQEAVGPGQTKTFQSTLVAPSTPGRYYLQFGMLQEYVVWFGTFSDPVVIDVRWIDDAVPVRVDIPARLLAGQTATAHVTVRNVGNTVWNAAAGYALKALPSPSLWGTDRAELSPSETVAAGAEKTFDFQVTAPAQAGRYSLQWQMQKNAQAFGQASASFLIEVQSPPTVGASGPANVVYRPTLARLTGTASDAGMLDPSGQVATQWTQVSGPGQTSFGNAAALETTASFSAEGDYVLRLTATAQGLSATSDVTVRVRDVLPVATQLSPANVSLPVPTDTVTLSWNPVPGAVSYAVRMNDDTEPALRDSRNTCPNSPHYLCLNDWTQTSVSVPVKRGHAFTWWVHGIDADGGLGTLSAATFQTQINGAQFIANQSVLPPTRLLPGQTFQATIAMKNTGTSAWSESVPIRLANTPGWGMDRVTLGAGETVAPNATKVFSFTITAPQAAALYDYQSAMVQDGVELFGEFSPNTRISVQAPPTVSAVGPSGVVYRPSAANLSGTASDAHMIPPTEQVTVQWGKVSGPGSVNFSAGAALATTASFSAPGDYVLRLTATAQGLSAYSEVTVRVRDVLPAAMQLLPANTALPVPTDTVTLTWRPIPGAVSYAVRMNDDTEPALRDSRNTCPNSPHYLCLNDWTSNSVSVAVKRGHSFTWWVHGMDAYGGLGTLASATFQTQINGAQYLPDQSVLPPSRLLPGQTFDAKVAIKNTGTSTWSEAVPVRLGNTPDWGVDRVMLGANETVAPNATKVFSFTITAPQAAGVYNFQSRMVQDGVEFFGDSSANAAVSVRPALPAPSALRPSGATLPSGTATALLQWGSVPGAVRYAVRAVDDQDAQARDSRNDCGASVPHYLCINRVTSTSIDLPVRSGHSYTWWVHAVEPDGTLGAGASAPFGVASTLPLRIKAVTATPAVVSGTQAALAVAAEGGSPPYQYRWSAVSGATFDLQSRTPTVTFSRSGDYRFDVRVLDAAGQTADGNVSVKVDGSGIGTDLPLPAPVLTLPSVLRLGDRVSFDYPGGTRVRQFAWSFVPQGLFNGALAASPAQAVNTITAAPSADLRPLGLSAGPYSVTVTARDAAGLEARSNTAFVTLTSEQLSAVRVFPNPWKASQHSRGVVIDGLPAGTTVKIFSISGRLVRDLGRQDGLARWDLRTQDGDEAASGLYLVLVSDPSGGRQREKLVIIR